MKQNETSVINIKTTLIVMGTVVINLLAAWVLSTAAELGTSINIITLTLLGVVIALNVGRFVLWGWIHRRINLSKSYPLTAMFFPAVAFLSFLQGENITLAQWLGICLITTGVIWFTVFVADT